MHHPTSSTLGSADITFHHRPDSAHTHTGNISHLARNVYTPWQLHQVRIRTSVAQCQEVKTRILRQSVWFSVFTRKVLLRVRHARAYQPSRVSCLLSNTHAICTQKQSRQQQTCPNQSDSSSEVANHQQHKTSVANVVLSTRLSKQDFVHITNTTFAESRRDDGNPTLRPPTTISPHISRRTSPAPTPSARSNASAAPAPPCNSRCRRTTRATPSSFDMGVRVRARPRSSKKFFFFPQTGRPRGAETRDQANVTYSTRRRRLLTKLIVVVDTAAAIMRRNPGAVD